MSKKRKKVKYNCVSLPNNDGTKYLWDGFDVVDVVGKGKGVVATKDLSSGFLFPLGGRVITKRDAEILCSHSSNGSRSDYLIAIHQNHNSSVYEFCLDGNPQRMAIGTMMFAWPGMACNEPDREMTANARITTLYFRNKLDTNTPKYPYIDSNFPLFIELCRDVKVGEEITVCYKWHPRTYKRLGYIPGKDWDGTQIQPHKPQVTDCNEYKQSSKQLANSKNNLTKANKKRKEKKSKK
jgi:hypothetical protein